MEYQKEGKVSLRHPGQNFLVWDEQGGFFRPQEVRRESKSIPLQRWRALIPESP